MSAAVRAERARTAYKFLEPLISELREAGLSYQRIADGLNRRGHTTRLGRPWSAMAVWTLWQRMTEAASA